LSFSHSQIWIYNRIASLVEKVGDKLVAPSAGYRLGGWVNGNNYTRSPESFGILPVTQLAELGMQPYAGAHAVQQKPRHDYLAQNQGSLIAILPAHTKQEKSMFRLLCSIMTNKRGEPDWMEFCRKWALQLDGKHIFYKLCCPLPLWSRA